MAIVARGVNPEEAGRWLRSQRERRGLSVREVAARLDVLPQTVYNWEAGKSGLDDDRADQVAELLEVDVIALRRHLGMWLPPQDRVEQFEVQDELDKKLARIRADRERREMLDKIADAIDPGKQTG